MKASHPKGGGMKKFTVLLATVLGTALLLPMTAHADRYRLSLSTWGSPKHPQVTQFVPTFVKLVETRSKGRIRFRVFEGGEMVKQRFVPTAVPQGTVDISLTTLDSWSGRIPEVSILTSPLWTWSMKTSRDQLLPGKQVFTYFDQKLRDQGALMIAMFDIGPPILSTNFPLAKPSDLKGHTMRVYSKGAGLVMQNFGAAPTTLGVGEVYSALQRGTVDGAMGGLGGAVGLKHYEVTKYTFDQQGALGTLVHAYVMNKAKFESLPPDLQKVVLDAATEARNQAQQYMIDSYEKLLAKVAKHGNVVARLKPGSPEWNEWRSALKPMVVKAKATYPADLVKLVANGASE
jgi:TRAP-type C4-dicarboxylate transport system substrate-binding protein